MNKLVYRFNNKDSKKSFNSKDILGGKGANLAQMAGLNLPVPPGFTISTKICEFFFKNLFYYPNFFFYLLKNFF